jgi:hypothetical protein
MRKSTRFISGLAMAGIVAAAGSAFTATSDIDHDTRHVGAVSQTMSGVNVNNVQYTVDPDTDTTTKVTFHVDEELDAWDTLKATISSTDPVHAETVPCTAAAETQPATPGTDLACDFAAKGVVNVTKLDIVAS